MKPINLTIRRKIMENIHFVNVNTGNHEFCDMKTWCLTYCNSLAAQMITLLKIAGLPIAFSMKGADGDGYIIAADTEFNNPFTMAHEEGHLKLGHYEVGAGVQHDEAGILDDIEAEIAADKYAVEKTQDKQAALAQLQVMSDRIDAAPMIDPTKKLKAQLEYSRRMLAIATM